MDIPGSDRGDGSVEVPVVVGGDRVVVRFGPDHLVAHADDFTLAWDELVEAITASLEQSGTRTGPVHAGFEQGHMVGWTGLVEIGPDDAAFWGYRPGRTIPSHLIVGTRVPTDELCVWGTWRTRESFDLVTCYPGAPAPREIHDPEIGLDEIDAAIAFWTAHAIVVDAVPADRPPAEPTTKEGGRE